MGHNTLFFVAISCTFIVKYGEITIIIITITNLQKMKIYLNRKSKSLIVLLISKYHLEKNCPDAGDERFQRNQSDIDEKQIVFHDCPHCLLIPK